MNEAIGTAVLARIAALWRRREWYRSHLGWIVQSKIEDDCELRQLVRLAREARKTQHRRRQPVGVGFHDWQAERDGDPLTEPELLAGYGVAPDFDREGDPAFNGAFSRW